MPTPEIATPSVASHKEPLGMVFSAPAGQPLHEKTSNSKTQWLKRRPKGNSSESPNFDTRLHWALVGLSLNLNFLVGHVYSTYSQLQPLAWATPPSFFSGSQALKVASHPEPRRKRVPISSKRTHQVGEPILNFPNLLGPNGHELPRTKAAPPSTASPPGRF